jgi:hypothetical protein
LPPKLALRILASVVARSLFASLLFSVAALAAPAIGIVTASGHFSVEGSQVWGNATLFDGTTVETSAASSELDLRNGVKVHLAAGSRARVWQNRLVLEKGIAQLAAPVSFEARVSQQAKLIRAPFKGSVAMQAAQGQTAHTGCMVYKDGHFLLQDQNTQDVIEISGRDLPPNVGNRVEVRGAVSNAPGVAPATSSMNVVSVALVAQGGCLSIAATLDAKTEVPATAAAPVAASAKPPSPPPSPSPTPAAHTGMSTGAKIGIVAAIGGGGAGAAIALSGPKSSTSQLSRRVHSYNGLCPSPLTRLSKQTRTGCSPS